MMPQPWTDRVLRLIGAPDDFEGTLVEYGDLLIAEEDARLAAEAEKLAEKERRLAEAKEKRLAEKEKRLVEAQERRLAAARTPLERLLVEQGVTQDELAASLGVSQAIVSRWVSGKTVLPEARIDQIDELLGCGESLDGMRPMKVIALEGSPLDHYNGYLFFWARVGWQRFDTDAQLVKEVAEFLDVPLRTVQEWQYGIAFPTEEQAERIVRRYLPGVVEVFGLTR